MTSKAVDRSRMPAILFRQNISWNVFVQCFRPGQVGLNSFSDYKD